MPGCLLPALMAAGMPSPAEIGLLAPGPRLTVRPPSPTKGTYGTPLSHHLDTENFSIQWETPAMDLAIAEQVGEDMEEAWDAFCNLGIRCLGSRVRFKEMRVGASSGARGA